MLTCDGISSLTAAQETVLTFIGGFDPPETVFDHSMPTSFLALQYPAAEAEDLRNSLGTMDLLSADAE